MTVIDRRALMQLGATVAAIWSIPAFALPDPPVPGLERRYISCRFGQLHLRIARPARAVRGRPPLVLFHQTPLSGRMFEHILPHLADGRFAIAVDTPGYGESDRPAERPTLAAYGDAILDALAGQFGNRIDLLGYHTGAAIALDLAARRRAARRLVLIAVPLLDAARRQPLLTQLAADKDPFPADGSALLQQWSGSVAARPPDQSIEDVARLVAEKQRGGRHYEWALRSAMEADLVPLADRIKVRALVIAPHDGLQGPSAEAARLMKARLIERPDWRYGLFDAAPKEVATMINLFLAEV